MTKKSSEGTLRIGISGALLRGSGERENETVMIAAGPSRRTLIEIGGRRNSHAGAARREFPAAVGRLADPRIAVTGARVGGAAQAV